MKAREVSYGLLDAATSNTTKKFYSKAAGNEKRGGFQPRFPL